MLVFTEGLGHSASAFLEFSFGHVSELIEGHVVALILSFDHVVVNDGLITLEEDVQSVLIFGFGTVGSSVLGNEVLESLLDLANLEEVGRFG